jgi:hypothetical protein
MTGFFEESVGVRSATRLVMIWLTVLASLLVVTLIVYVLYEMVHKQPIDQFVILAIVGGIGAVVLNGAVAIVKRNGGEP